MLDAYMRRMRNNNLKIKIAGSSCRPQNDKLIGSYCLRPSRFFCAQNALSLPETPAMLANKGYGTEIKKSF